jgi:hypothetical protein
MVLLSADPGLDASGSAAPYAGLAEWRGPERETHGIGDPGDPFEVLRAAAAGQKACVRRPSGR